MGLESGAVPLPRPSETLGFRGDGCCGEQVAQGTLPPWLWLWLLGLGRGAGVGLEGGGGVVGTVVQLPPLGQPGPSHFEPPSPPFPPVGGGGGGGSWVGCEPAGHTVV